MRFPVADAILALCALFVEDPNDHQATLFVDRVGGELHPGMMYALERAFLLRVQDRPSADVRRRPAKKVPKWRRP